jgi:hypothetical protein
MVYSGIFCMVLHAIVVRAYVERTPTPTGLVTKIICIQKSPPPPGALLWIVSFVEICFCCYH